MKRRGFLSLLGAAALAPFVPLPVAELPPVSKWTAIDGLLKEYYAEGRVKSIDYETAGTFFSMIRKSEAFR